MAPTLGALLRGAGVLLTALCGSWLLFAVLVHEDGGAAGRPPGLPRAPASAGGGGGGGRRALGRAYRSPAPEVRPVGKPPFAQWLGEEYNLRQCQCLREWRLVRQTNASASVCRCSRDCPAGVTPVFLTEADGQSLCSLEAPQGYNCYAECEGPTSSSVKWYATPCGPDAQQTACDAAIPLAKRTWKNGDAGAEGSGGGGGGAGGSGGGGELAAGESEAAAEKAAKEAEAAEAGAAEAAKKDAVAAAAAAAAAVSASAKDLVDLRGMHCELLAGVERCYVEDEQGRELCPPHVTSAYLSNPSDQYLCSAEMSDTYYCTAGCQEGSDEVRWGAHEIAWCRQPANAAGCPARVPPVPRADFKLREWSEVKAPESACAAAWRRGERPREKVERLSMGLLTHEPVSFRASMLTYKALGLFDVAIEFLIYANKRRPEIDAVAEEFRREFPDVIRVMGDAENHGIARGMTWLTGNATQPNFLFLERDFQLLEPGTCVLEQLGAAAEMISTGAATAVRLRSRHFEGKPNRAAELFRGSEWLAFETRHWGGFPKYVCSLYHWLEVRGERAHARERARRACAHAFARTRLRARARTLTHAPCMLACNANAARRRRT